MSFSGKSVHRCSLSGGLEAFLEAHEHAFSVLGGVPFGQIRYDNLKAAVARLLGLGRLREETDRWTAYRSVGFDAFYCQPGQRGAHKKGGVEGQIGWYRRNHMVPVPDVESIDELNAMTDAWDAADDARRIGARPHTIGEYFAAEKPLLKPLPREPFEAGRWCSPRVDRYALITARTNRYSVPVRLIGRQVRVLLHASHLVVYEGRSPVTRHERLPGKARSRLELDHYLEGLLRKPGALPGATALEQARATGKFTPVHDAWWAAARKAHGDAEGTPALIEVLLLHRSELAAVPALRDRLGLIWESASDEERAVERVNALLADTQASPWLTRHPEMPDGTCTWPPRTTRWPSGWVPSSRWHWPT
jgi:hypothetical protein